MGPLKNSVEVLLIGCLLLLVSKRVFELIFGSESSGKATKMYSYFNTGFGFLWAHFLAVCTIFVGLLSAKSIKPHLVDVVETMFS